MLVLKEAGLSIATANITAATPLVLSGNPITGICMCCCPAWRLLEQWESQCLLSPLCSRLF